ncbi:hypothetical protein HBH98_128020 [Parastagonospora nodorum]|nr:hypothetical protein HBH51_025430 [Parastagonospora nodorum]KAH4051684.1 hypothetical protein HBH49_106710 [Parastagonospora nodorum]KAH4250496.1 hypothetical protein HBI03_240030 [Parastagonospora nodorum]KAH4344767.1 hypothetical protein HBH98_128020 [Parastagonospora nodorum]KAH5015397.1 hypothetical protein HBI77_058900 [Parastagonospora nodorum]
MRGCGSAFEAEQAAVALSGSQQSSKVHDAAQLCGNSDTISTANTATMNGRRLHTRSRSTYSWLRASPSSRIGLEVSTLRLDS